MISILDIGGNYGSLLAAFSKLGIDARVESRDATEANGSAYVLPGVGRADNAMEVMREQGWDDLITSTTRPVLGICCGYHIMCRHSEEGDVEGLGIFPWHVKKLARARFGWENTEFGWQYVCHGYGVLSIDGSVKMSSKQGNMTGVQFHPEKGGVSGLKLLREWAGEI